MSIRNGLLLGEDFIFRKENIVFTQKILEIGSCCDNSCKEEFDATGCYVIPGLVDTHMHSAVGEAFIEAERDTARNICAFEAACGTTSLIPTLGGASCEKTIRMICYLVAEAKKINRDDRAKCAAIRGIHLEGPFFSKKYCGSFLPEDFREVSKAEMESYMEVGKGMLRIVSLAPELPGALLLTRLLRQNKITVSAGHSGASFKEMQQAVQAGVLRTTHTFNAMAPLHHRSPGILGAALMQDEVYCELICDLFHVHPEIIRMVYRLKGPDRIIAISDSEIGTGLRDGKYITNGRRITVKNGETYAEDGSIYGSSVTLLQCVRNLVKIGIPLSEAVKMASFNPAVSSGIADETGSLSCGKTADILVLDPDLRLKAVFLRGNLISRI